MALILALLLQQDWSDLSLERPLAPDPLERLKERISAWGNALGIDEFRDFGSRAGIREAFDRPLISLSIRLLVETRQVQRTRKPYAGKDERQRTTGEIDPWGPPTPEHSGFRSGQWTLPVEGSEQTLACAPCRETGRIPCDRCRGRREVDCDRCRAAGTIACSTCSGSGKKNCSTCNGSGRDRCSTCGGDGRRGFGSDKKRCTWCSGSGKRNCGRCSSGKVTCTGCQSGKVTCPECRGERQLRCARCQSDGKIPCPPCDGHGRILDAQVISIALRIRQTPEVLTRLPAPWHDRLPPAATEVLSADAYGAAVAKVADEDLRGRLAGALETARRDAGGPIRAEEVRAAVHRCLHAGFEYRGRPYEVVALGDRLFLEPSPVRAWAQSEVAAAREEWNSGREAAAEARIARLRGVETGWMMPVELEEELGAFEVERLSRRQAREHQATVGSAFLTCLFGVAGVILALMIVLRLYLVFRRRTAA